jgi:hypothetical protein
VGITEHGPITMRMVWVVAPRVTCGDNHWLNREECLDTLIIVRIELIQRPWNHGEEFGVDVVRVRVAARLCSVFRYHMLSADERPHAFTPALPVALTPGLTLPRSCIQHKQSLLVMSLATLVSGADCGPVNPLQSLTKNLDSDRGLQQVHTPRMYTP